MSTLSINPDGWKTYERLDETDGETWRWRTEPTVGTGTRYAVAHIERTGRFHVDGGGVRFRAKIMLGSGEILRGWVFTDDLTWEQLDRKIAF